MRLTFPKYVEIQNPRLNILYYLLFLTMLAFNVSRFFVYKQYTDKVAVVSRLSTRLSNQSSEEMRRGQLVEPSMAICEKASCLPLCRHWGQASSQSCVNPRETFVEEGSDRVFVATSFLDTFVSGNASAGVQPTKGERMFVASAEALQLRLAYNYKLEESPPDFLWWENKFHGQSESCLTVVLRREEDIGLIVSPGEPIHLTAVQLLDLASAAPWDTQGEESKRLGAELVASVDCYVDNSDLTMALDLDWSSRLPGSATMERPVCLLRLQLAAAFAQRVRDSPNGLAGETRFRSYSGIRVRCEAGRGSFRYWDINVIIVNLTSALVLLVLPKKVLLLFSTSALGQMSKIYRRVIVEPFDEIEQCAGVSTRLMAYSATFVELTEPGQGGEGGTITKSRMRERLKEVLRYRDSTLNPHEVDAFVNFCYHQAVHHKKPDSILHELFSEMKSRKVDARGSRSSSRSMSDDIEVDIDKFAVSCCSNERLDFETVVKLFDRDRRLGLLESLFMPYTLWKCIREEVEVTLSEKSRSQEEFVGSENSQVEALASDETDMPVGPRMNRMSAWEKEKVFVRTCTLEQKKFRNATNMAGVPWMKQRVEEMSTRDREHDDTVRSILSSLAEMGQTVDSLVAGATPVHGELSSIVAGGSAPVDENSDASDEKRFAALEADIAALQVECSALRSQERGAHAASDAQVDAPAVELGSEAQAAPVDPDHDMEQRLGEVESRVEELRDACLRFCAEEAL